MITTITGGACLVDVLIQLLQGLIRCLRHEKVTEDCCQGTKHRKENEGSVCYALDHWWHNNPLEKVKLVRLDCLLLNPIQFNEIIDLQ